MNTTRVGNRPSFIAAALRESVQKPYQGTRVGNRPSFIAAPILTPAPAPRAVTRVGNRPSFIAAWAPHPVVVGGLQRGSETDPPSLRRILGLRGVGRPLERGSETDPPSLRPAIAAENPAPNPERGSETDPPSLRQDSLMIYCCFIGVTRVGNRPSFIAANTPDKVSGGNRLTRVGNRPSFIAAPPAAGTPGLPA